MRVNVNVGLGEGSIFPRASRCLLRIDGSLGIIHHTGMKNDGIIHI